MNTLILNFILPGSLIRNDQEIPSYMKDYVSHIKTRMENSDLDGLFDLCPEAMEVNYKIFRDKLLKPGDFQFQKIEKIIKKWSEATNEKIDLHLCYNLEFFYKFLLNNYNIHQIRFDEKFIQELEPFVDKMKFFFKSSSDDTGINEIDDQIALTVSLLKIDLISIVTTLYLKEGTIAPKSFIEKINNCLVQETHKIIKVFSKHDLPVVVNNKYDIAWEGLPDYGFRPDTAEDDEFSEPDLAEWNKSLDE